MASDDITIIAMQSRPEPGSFGLCYECQADGRGGRAPNEHLHCIGVPCACSCDSSPWLIYTKDEKAPGHTLLWWRPKSTGYTRFVEEAGRYSFDEAKKICQNPDEGMVPARLVRERMKSVLPIEALNDTPYAWGPPAVPASQPLLFPMARDEHGRFLSEDERAKRL